MKSDNQHWNTIFAQTQSSNLGWYEQEASQTLKLLGLVPQWQDSTVFLPGVGTSVLIDELLANNTRLILNDISMEALNQVKARLGDKSAVIQYLCQDIAQPIVDVEQNVDIWIDRAVLHFLLEEHDIQAYFDNVKSTLSIGGYALFAEFSETGASKCAGLPVHRYSVDELSERLGTEFKLMHHEGYTFINPHGDLRSYLYTLYERQG